MELYRAEAEADCEELLKRFKETGSVRFEAFKTVWREMKFSQIFYGAATWESRAFSRLILNAACSFFLPPFSFHVRVGGLYLLHSLYHCQTTAPPEQIRVALKDWGDVKKLEKDAVDAQHYDVVYILRQLVSHKAFHFTAMPSALTFKSKRKVERSALCDDFIERTSRPQELVSMELLEELSNVHELYEKMKASVSSTSDSASSVSLIRKNLIPELRNAVVDFYKWQHTEDVEDDSGEGSSSQQDCSDRATLLAAIKSKAFGHATEACKSRRHRQVELDVTSNEVADVRRRGSRPVKRSLKARTLTNVNVSGDLWTDAADTTMISRLTTLSSE
ncbi:snRNA-activating protein complex subunit 1b [Antennarius striatus]|uniref:snRNA-activating protein complex subunit 1b n=1 Tax=Antennarius striatus TaxID=241820 RepID=UPI0035B0CE54